jgi:hypothetical protein
MAERGGQPGNQNAASGKKWKAAIDRALESKSRSDGKVAIDAIAEKLVELAMEGERWATEEIGNRQDGKPNQTVEATVKGDLASILTAIGKSSNDDPPLEG